MPIPVKATVASIAVARLEGQGEVMMSLDKEVNLIFVLPGYVISVRFGRRVNQCSNTSPFCPVSGTTRPCRPISTCSGACPEPDCGAKCPELPVMRLSPSKRARLRQVLVKYFSIEELRDVMFDLGVADDSLDEGKQKLARELVLQLDRLGQIDLLLVKLQRERPNLFASLSHPRRRRPTDAQRSSDLPEPRRSQGQRR